MNYVIRKDYYMGQSVQDRQPLKYHIKFFEGSLPQISLGPFLNALSHLFAIGYKWVKVEALSLP